MNARIPQSKKSTFGADCAKTILTLCKGSTSEGKRENTSGDMSQNTKTISNGFWLKVDGCKWYLPEVARRDLGVRVTKYATSLVLLRFVGVPRGQRDLSAHEIF